MTPPRPKSSARLRSHRTFAVFTLALATLTATACDPGDELEAEDVAEVVLVNDLLEIEADATPVQREPDLVLQLADGATLGFMIEADGSVGMLEEITADAGVASVLDDPWLRDASPAVVWYALTKDGTEIPEGLRAHHEGLAAIGEVAPLAEALAGQLRDLAPVPLADESPCLNATFNTNHCAHPDYDDDLCLFNTGGNWTWSVNAVDRYKAGFCLQSGTARSWLSYGSGAAPVDGQCVYFNDLYFVWGIDSSGGFLQDIQYSATTYLYHVWWRGANSGKRRYTHRVSGNPGAVFDFGNRYSTSPCN